MTRFWDKSLLSVVLLFLLTQICVLKTDPRGECSELCVFSTDLTMQIMSIIPKLHTCYKWVFNVIHSFNSYLTVRDTFK